MKELISEITMPWLKWKHKLIVWYFVISLCFLGSIAEAPFWFLVILVVNFANAARLIKKVPFPKSDNDTNI